MPPTVTTYRQCFDLMLDNAIYKDNFDRKVTDEEDQDSREAAWSFFAELEAEYNCAGICHRPLFYLTKGINTGRPQRECLAPLFEDVFGKTTLYSYGLSGLMALSLICQLGLCGGMPASSDIPIDDPDAELVPD